MGTIRNQLDDQLFSSDSDNGDVTTPGVTEAEEETGLDSDSDSLHMLSEEQRVEGERARLAPPADIKPRKSQFTASKWDLIKVTANRIAYSKQYIIAYIVLTILSVVTVAISLAAHKGCPHFAFYIFECIVLIALVLEVGIRILALRRFFWKSWWNVLDAILLVLCIVTFGLVFAGCSTAVRRSRQSSTVLLVIRNFVQVLRIIHLLWQNSRNIQNRHYDIDLDNVEDMGFELLPEEQDPEQIWSVEDEPDRRL